jgi:hypothetical protein
LPKPTQVQLNYGGGPTSTQRFGDWRSDAAAPEPETPQNPPGVGAVAQLHYQLFGTTPPRMQMVAREQNGGLPPSPPKAPATGVQATPATAGTVNSAVPGAMNGQPANGYPKEEIGATDAATTAQPAPPASSPQAIQTLQTQLAGGAAATNAPAPTQEPAAAPPAPPMQPAGMPKSAPAPTYTNAAGQPYTGEVHHLGEAGTEAYDAPKPQNWQQWPQERRDAWKAQHRLTAGAAPGGGAPGGGQQQPAPSSLNDLQAKATGWGINNLGPLPPVQQFNVGNLPANTDPLYLANVLTQAGAPPVIARIAGVLHDTVYGGGPGLNNGLSLTEMQADGSWTGAKNRALLTKQLAEMESVLAAYGISYQPYSAFVQTLGPGTPPGGAPPSGGDGQQGGGPPVTDQPGSGGQTLPVEDDGFNDTDFSESDGNLDLPDLTWRSQKGDVLNAWNSLSGDDEHKQFLLEYMAAEAERENANQRQQQGVNILGDAYDRFRNNPNRAASDKLLEQIVANPDNTPWETIANERATSIAKGTEAAVSGLGASLARRGVSAGAGAGITANLKRDASNELARQLGEIEVAKAAAEREGQYRALGALGSNSQLYYGGDMAAAGQLANYVGGAPQAASNPYAGWGDNYVNYQALIEAQKADNGGGFGWSDALSIAGGAGGFAVGGPAGAAVGMNLGRSVGGGIDAARR